MSEKIEKFDSEEISTKDIEEDNNDDELGERIYIDDKTGFIMSIYE